MKKSKDNPINKVEALMGRKADVEGVKLGSSVLIFGKYKNVIATVYMFNENDDEGIIKSSSYLDMTDNFQEKWYNLSKKIISTKDYVGISFVVEKDEIKHRYDNFEELVYDLRRNTAPDKVTTMFYDKNKTHTYTIVYDDEFFCIGLGNSQ